MTQSVLVTGGTGTLGRVVASRLLAKGWSVRVFSRRAAPVNTPYDWRTGDLHRGGEITDAVAGVNAVVHCATTIRRGGDVVATRRLVDAARQTGSPRLVYVSIVGVDRVPLFYYRAKLACERLIEESGLPWTILRATQFHDLILAMSSRQKWLPATFVPSGVRFQPIDVRDVADRLVELMVGRAEGRVPDMGGPEVREARELASTYLRVVGRHRAVVPVPLPGKAGRAYRAGGHLAPGRITGKITFEQFLRGAEPEA
jgi:uncharacterized protein YbjT (DUF2867 family)